MAKGFASKLEHIARPLGIGTTVLSSVEAITDFAHGDWKGGLSHTADAIMGGIGLTGWGAPIAAVYFGGKLLGELFDWW